MLFKYFRGNVMGHWVWKGLSSRFSVIAHEQGFMVVCQPLAATRGHAQIEAVFGKAVTAIAFAVASAARDRVPDNDCAVGGELTRSADYFEEHYRQVRLREADDGRFAEEIGDMVNLIEFKPSKPRMRKPANPVEGGVTTFALRHIAVV
jgi:hypothetical protein